MHYVVHLNNIVTVWLVHYPALDHYYGILPLCIKTQ